MTGPLNGGSPARIRQRVEHIFRVRETEPMTSFPDDLSFQIETMDGAVQAVISATVLTRLAGRSHVTGFELIDVYRIELEDIVKSKAGRRGAGIVRIEAGDL
jgi:hypothetical protein